MQRNPDNGWQTLGGALQPVLERIAAKRGMSRDQFLAWAAAGATKPTAGEAVEAGKRCVEGTAGEVESQ